MATPLKFSDLALEVSFVLSKASSLKVTWSTTLGARKSASVPHYSGDSTGDREVDSEKSIGNALNSVV